MFASLSRVPVASAYTPRSPHARGSLATMPFAPAGICLQITERFALFGLFHAVVAGVWPLHAYFLVVLTFTANPCCRIKHRGHGSFVIVAVESVHDRALCCALAGAGFLCAVTGLEWCGTGVGTPTAGLTIVSPRQSRLQCDKPSAVRSHATT